MARNIAKFSWRGIALDGIALLVCGASPALIITAHASDDAPAAASATVTTDAKAVSVAVKRDAQVVADAAKEGAQQVSEAAKEVAHEVATAAKQGAQEVAAAAKKGAKKAQAAVKSDKAGPAANTDNKAAP
jgi:hypothetical protein